MAMELFKLFGSAFFIGFTGAMMPGPLLAVTVTETVHRGAWSGPLLMIGHAILEAALVAGLALGIVSFLKQPAVLGGIGLLGGLLLLWMGADMLRTAGRLTLKTEASAPAPRRMHPVLAGIVVSMSNPYWTIWWVMIGSGYVIMGLEYGLLGLLVFFTGHILSDIVWYTFVSVSLARGRHLLPDNAFRWMVRVCAVGLLYFGITFLRMGWGRVTGAEG